VDLAEQAVAANHQILDVKGPSILHLLPDFDIMHGLVDYMHSVLLGVARQLEKLWFDSMKHFYCGPQINFFCLSQ